MPVVLLGMQDRKNQNGFTLDAIDDSIWKTWWIKPSNPQPPMAQAINQRILRQPPDGVADSASKVVAQAHPLLLVPLPCLLQVRLGARTDDDAPHHCGDGLRRRTSTFSQGEPDSGFLR